MDDQAALKHEAPAPTAESRGMLGGVGAFGLDLAALASLQARMLALDAAEATRRSWPGLAALAAVAVVAPAVFGVGVLGLLLWLARITGWTLERSSLVVAGLGLTVLIVATVLGLLGVRNGLRTFRRSAEELRRNLAWVQASLREDPR